jgi:uncharacterized protein (TIGR00106 family)
MIAEFSVYPMDSVHMFKDVAPVADILAASGLPYRIGPMGTCVEGDWDRLMAVIRQCQQAMAEAHERVLTTIVIDDHKTQPRRLQALARSVTEEMDRRVPRADMDAVC